MVKGVDADDTLVVHLRGGDALRRARDYFAAPCAFYKHVIRNGNNGTAFKNVVVVSDVPNHPCLQIIKEERQNSQFKVFISKLESDFESVSHGHIDSSSNFLKDINPTMLLDKSSKTDQYS